MNTANLLGVLLLISASVLEAEIRYFVVGEKDTPVHHDSYILPLEREEDIRTLGVGDILDLIRKATDLPQRGAKGARKT